MVTLKKNYQFRLVYNKGLSFANRVLVMYVRKNAAEKNYIGVSVSKKVGKSVVRSKVTRRIKESYRALEKLYPLPTGFDIVFVARTAAKDSLFWEMQSSMKHLMKKHGFITTGHHSQPNQE